MPKLEQFLQTHDYPCWCGQTSSKLFCKQMFGRRHFAALECAACGTHRVLPKALPNQNAAETLYNEYEGPDVCDADRDRVGNKMLGRLAATEITFAKGKRVLDVGCGSGVLVERIGQQFGCACQGIDVDRRRIEKARALSKFASFECGLFDSASVKEPYDVLISSAVIEHVTDPVDFLRQLRMALAEGGSLFLLTPNASSLNYRLLRSWWRELLSIGEHIYLFTPESLEQCAKKAGFELVKAASDFDWYWPRMHFNGLRPSAITLWGCYRELVKHVAARLASPVTGDILYAHFRKV